MTINTKELQRFYDVWGPMISSLPAVINASERSDELQRHVLQLEAQAQAAIAAKDQAVAEQSKELTTIKDEIAALSLSKKEQTAALKAHERACKDKAEAADAAADAKIAQSTGRAEAAELAAAKAELDLKDRTEALEVQFEADKLTKLRALDELDAKHLAAQQALSELREKLG